MFKEKFVSTIKEVTSIDLRKEHKKIKEDLMEYIQHFIEIVLDIYKSHDENNC